MNNRSGFLALVIAALAWTSVASDSAGTDSARIFQYIHDGDETITRVLITSLGGPIVASITIGSMKEPREYMFEVEPFLFGKIWAGFESIEVLRNGETTDKPEDEDARTHHLFLTQEESAAGSKGRTFGVAESDATPEFNEWLKLFVPDQSNEDDDEE